MGYRKRTGGRLDETAIASVAEGHEEREDLDRNRVTNNFAFNHVDHEFGNIRSMVRNPL